jgi:hypothetical protein
MGEGGVKNGQKLRDVIYGQPLYLIIKNNLGMAHLRHMHKRHVTTQL